MSGYRAQFDYFAEVVYDGLRNKSLVNIRVADARNGILDDICYETEEELHAAQMKHSSSEKRTFSYRNFTELFPDLVQSWVNIRRTTAKKVVPHLIVTFAPSSHDCIDTREQQGIGSFSDFLESILPLLVRQQKLPYAWQKAMDELACKLSTEEQQLLPEFWQVFQLHCDLKDTFTAKPPGTVRQKDILQLYHFLQELSGDKSAPRTLTGEQLIHALGWEHRLRSEFNHHPHPDSGNPVPMEALRARLEHTIRDTESGYIFLEGCPGSGKSTFLSLWADSCAFSTSRYLAYDFTDRTARTNYSARGTTSIWLRDLIFQLREQFPGENPTYLVSEERNDLIADFLRYLSLAHEHYTQTGQKHLIIIDGLDHVPREYTDISDSFIKQLLPPSNIPKGVIFILGSQIFRNLKQLPSPLLSQYQEPKRRLLMPTFSAEESRSLLRQTLAVTLTEPQHEQLYRIAAGHPLTTHYLVQELNGGAAPEEVLSEERTTFSGDIETYYRDLTRREITENGESSPYITTLHLLARCENEVREDFLDEWALCDRAAFLRRFAPLFEYDAARRTLRFFHNSFRRFILQELTNHPISGEWDAKADAAHYSQLADFYRKSAVEPHWLSYAALFRAGRFSDFTAEATPEAIVQSLADFRPLREAKQDAALGVRIAAEQCDITLLARYLLCLSRLERIRAHDTGEGPDYHDLYVAGYTEEARRIIRENLRMQHDTIGLLQLVSELRQRGDHKQAEALFRRLYPPFVHATKEQLSRTTRAHCFDVATAWIQAAAGFLPSEEIRNTHYPRFLAALQHTKDAPLHPQTQDAVQLTEHFDTCLAYALLEQADFPEMAVQVPYAQLSEQHRFGLLLYAIQNDLTGKGWESCCDELLQLGETIGGIDRIRAAHTLYKAGDETHGRITEILRCPDGAAFCELYHPYQLPGEDFFDLLCHIYVCMRQLGGTLSPSELLDSVPGFKPSMNKRREFALRQLLAVHHGYLLRTGQAVPGEFATFCDHYADIYLNASEDDAYTEGELRRSLPAYYRTLMRVAREMNPQAMQCVERSLAELLRGSRIYVDAPLATEMVADWANCGGNRALCCTLLEKITARDTAYHQDADRTPLYTAVGRAWARLGENEKARDFFSKATTAAQALAPKNEEDTELFIDCADEAFPPHPTAEFYDFLHWFTTRMAYLEQTTTGIGILAAKLIDSAFSRSLAIGRKTALWLMQQGYLPLLFLLRGLIAALLRQEQTPLYLLADIYCRLCLPEEQASRPETCISLLHALRRLGQEKLTPDEAAELINHLRRGIEALRNEELREQLLSELDSPPQSAPPDAKHSEESPRLAILTRLEQGEREEAAQLAATWLEQSPIRSWNPHWSAGRLEAAELYARAMEHSEDAQRFIFRQVADDCTQEVYFLWQYSVRGLIRCTGRETAAVYPEWQRHLETLVPEEHTKPEDTPDLSDEPETPLSCIVHLLLRLSELPNTPIYRSIVRILADALLRRTPNVTELLVAPAVDERLLLRVAERLSKQGAALPAALRERIRAMGNATDFEVRKKACDLLSACGEQPPTPEPRRCTVPSLLSLPLIETPPSYASPEEIQFASLCRSMMVPALPNSPHLYPRLYAQIRSRLREQYGESAFSDDTDREAAYHLDRIGFEHGNIRASYLPLRKALMQVISDLVAEGYVAEHAVTLPPCLFDDDAPEPPSAQRDS